MALQKISPDKSKFIVISSLTKDILIYEDKLRKIRSGGPAHWIDMTLKDLKVPYQQILAKPETRVEIQMPEEKGVIISAGKIKIDHPIWSEGIIISTIGDEFSLNDIGKLHGTIALDIQGFARTTKQKKVNFRKMLTKIAILKATQSELKILKTADIRDQKKRILLVTGGSLGFEVFTGNRRYRFTSKKIEISNTIGAGDVLLTAFLVTFLRTNNPEVAGSFALDYVTKFIETKLYE